MWKFSKLIEVKKADPNQGQGLGIAFQAEFKNGKDTMTVGTVVADKEQLDNTIRVTEERLNKVDEDMAAIDTKTYTVPTVEEPVTPEPTPEELQEQEIAKAEQELQEAVDKAKRDAEVAELAKIYPEVQAKLTALEVQAKLTALEAKKNPVKVTKPSI